VTKEQKAAYDKAYRAENRERLAALKAAWFVAHKERVLAAEREKYKSLGEEEKQQRNAKSIEWRKRNPEKAKQIMRRCYEKTKERRQAYQKAYRKNNKGKVNAKTMLRIARKRMASPPWVDKKAIEALYERAVFVSKETGVMHHVDHIYPLAGKTFSGLHVPWNLQILTASENCRKGNRIHP